MNYFVNRKCVVFLCGQIKTGFIYKGLCNKYGYHSYEHSSFCLQSPILYQWVILAGLCVTTPCNQGTTDTSRNM